MLTHKCAAGYNTIGRVVEKVEESCTMLSILLGTFYIGMYA